MLRDTTLPGIAPADRRQLEIIATGLPLARGVPLGCDVTLVSPLHTNGSPWRGADTQHSVAIERGERDKAATYPELVNSDQVLLRTLACEVGGRWSTECLRTVRELASAKARAAPAHLRQAARSAWQSRWWALLSVAVQDSLAATLVEDALPTLDGHDGAEPELTEVLLDVSASPAPSRLPLR